MILPTRNVEPDLGPICNKPGCSSARTKFSLFCDPHHHESLFGKLPKPEDPEALLERARTEGALMVTCLIRGYLYGATTRDDLYLNLYYGFMHRLGMESVPSQINVQSVKSGIDALASLLPREFNGLLSFIKGDLQPVMIRPCNPEREAAMAARSLRSRAWIIEALESRLNKANT